MHNQQCIISNDLESIPIDLAMNEKEWRLVAFAAGRFFIIFFYAIFVLVNNGSVRRCGLFISARETFTLDSSSCETKRYKM